MATARDHERVRGREEKLSRGEAQSIGKVTAHSLVFSISRVWAPANHRYMCLFSQSRSSVYSVFPLSLSLTLYKQVSSVLHCWPLIGHLVDCSLLVPFCRCRHYRLLLLFLLLLYLCTSFDEHRRHCPCEATLLAESGRKLLRS